MRRNRRGTRQSWLGAVLAVGLLLAESFALAHPLDSPAHANGQACSACVSLATFSAGAVSTPAPIQLDVTTPELVVAAATVFVSIAIQRRFARGPPVVSFVA